MKKAFSILLALILCVGMFAVAGQAASSPSSSKKNSSSSDTTVAATPAATAEPTEPALQVFVDPSEAAQEEDAHELTKLEESGKEAFFGEEIASQIDEATEGKLVALLPIAETGYEDSMGDVTVTISFPAAEALTEGQKVVVAIGTPSGVVDDEPTYDWKIVEGTANGQGGIVLTLDQETMDQIAEGGVLFAIYA